LREAVFGVIDDDVLEFAGECGCVSHGATAAEDVHEGVGRGQEFRYACGEFVFASFVGQSEGHGGG